MKITRKAAQKALNQRIKQAKCILDPYTAWSGWEAHVYKDSVGYFSVLEDNNTGNIWAADQSYQSYSVMWDGCHDENNGSLRVERLVEYLDESDPNYLPRRYTGLVLASKPEQYLMNPNTGSVDTEENWKAEMSTWINEDGELDPEAQQEQFDSLGHVVKDKNGDWVEAEKIATIPNYTAK